MRYRERLYGLLVEGLSQASKQTLSLNRLSRKQFNTKKGWNRVLELTFKREEAKTKIKTSPKRDVVRAATKAQL